MDGREFRAMGGITWRTVVVVVVVVVGLCSGDRRYNDMYTHNIYNICIHHP